MARYQIILAYDGTGFHGFQRQGITRTVQLEVENALRKLTWTGRSILAAGRTDTGVHASGQVVAFDLDWRHSLEDLGRALNAHLPNDISAQAIQEVGVGFHPRFDAQSRQYRYHIYCQELPNALRERFAWRLWPEPDFGLLQETACLAVGSHDFAAFGSPMTKGGVTERTVMLSEWQKCSQELCYTIQANAFLYRMVRRIVYLQVQVGLGKISLEEFTQGVHEAKPVKQGIAPPQGLVLVKVNY
jgi:tRNA pseudouridine38-40 synthase